MYTVLDPALRNPVYGTAGSGANTDGYLDIVVKTDSGAILTALYNTSGIEQFYQSPERFRPALCMGQERQWGRNRSRFGSLRLGHRSVDTRYE